MATILTKRSNTASSVPVAGDLTNSTGGAELAVNTADKRLFTKDSGGTVVELGTNPSTFSLPNGTANGVTYLNGSKVLTTGSALTFDGSKLATTGTMAADGEFQTTGGRIALYRAAGASYIDWASGQDLAWRTVTSIGGAGSAEQMRLTSTGLGIGTSSPAAKLDVVGTIQSQNNAATNDATVGAYNFLNSNSSAAANPIRASIVAGRENSAWGAYLDFYTSTGTSAQTSKMRLDSSGNLLVGTTSGSFGQTGFILNPSYNAAGSAGVAIQHPNGSASGHAYAGFIYNGTGIGSITQNGTTGVLYNLTSDYRLKNNPVALTGSGAFIDALRPKTWDWWDGSGKGVGFIAHEFMEVAKYSGNGEKDAVDADGKPVYQSIQPSSSEVMANLVAEIQSLRKRLAAAGIA